MAKPAASAVHPAAPAQKRDLEKDPEDVVEPGKKPRRASVGKTEDQKQMNNIKMALTRTVSSATVGGEAKVNASRGLETLKNLNKDEKEAFAKAFTTNKGQKGFGWIKEFEDKMKHEKKTSKATNEKWMTRISTCSQPYAYIYIYNSN